MAMGKPVVATREATRALDVTSGVHLWIENDPQRFADAVVRAINGPEREAVKQNARRYVEQHHNWPLFCPSSTRSLARLARVMRYNLARDRQTRSRAGYTPRWD